MKRTILLILAGIIFLAFTPLDMPIAEAENMMHNMRKKRYRYRQRTHRVQVDLNSMFGDTTAKQNFSLNTLYGYNGRYFEVGPNIMVSWAGIGDFSVTGGVWGEVNLIENTRKIKFIPSIGFKTNIVRILQDNLVLISPYLALKYFVASRTGFILNAGWELVIDPKQNNYSNLLKKGTGVVTLSYVHYFH